MYLSIGDQYMSVENKFNVAWIPLEQDPKVKLKQVTKIGGRVVFKNIPEKEAIEMQRILILGAPNDGQYIVIE